MTVFMKRRHLLAGAATGIMLISAFPALAEGTTIKVTLWDSGANGPMDTDMGYKMAHADPSKAKMGVRLSADSAPAGEINFDVTNSSKVFVHEMIVIPVPANGKPLPYNADKLSIDEDAAGAIGEVSEREPGQSGSLTLHLKAGKYLLLCNVPGHYAGGMWSMFTVK
jgi:uncharacterized cupredoxin-like copper-binding protein